MDDSRSDLSGTSIHGRYQLEKLLGVGGYGAVYRAKHLAMGNDVAIKLLHASQADPERAMKRFELEARRSASLKHPNTISVFDFGQTDDGRMFLAMEFLSGRPLGDLVRDGERFSPGRAVHILGQVLRSLDEAHTKGFIHRDLKPDNIFLTTIGSETDFVKVLDFGIAKAVQQGSSELTVTGTVIGTPMYMSPEQCRGRELDPRSDLYSVGCIAYCLLTGRPPFLSDSPVGYLLAHVESEPDDVRLVAGGENPVPSGLAAWIHKLLAKDPDDRFPTAQEAGMALANCLTGEATWEFKQPTGPMKGMKRQSPTMSKMATRNDQKPLSTHDLALPSGGKSGRGWIIAVVAMVLLGGGAAAVAVLSGGNDGKPAVAAGPEAGPEATAAPVAKAPSETEPGKGAATSEATDPKAAAADPSADPGKDTAPKTEPGSDKDPGAEQAPAAPKATIEVTLESEPSGALVVVDGKDLGPTPQVVSWSRGAAAPKVELKLAGHDALAVTLGDRDEGKARVYTLAKTAEPAVATPTPGDKPKTLRPADRVKITDKPPIAGDPKPAVLKPADTLKPADKPKYTFERIDDSAPKKPTFDRLE